MEIKLILTDSEDGKTVALASDFVFDEGAEGPVPNSMVAMLGIKMLFELGTAFNAGCEGLEMIAQGKDPLRVMREFREAGLSDQEVSDAIEAVAQTVAETAE